MKRSDMVEILALRLRMTGNHYSDNGRDIADADNLLKFLEDVGMLPPKKSTSRISNREKVKMIANNFKWEKE